MKRSNQLILESLVIASILLGVLLAGSVSTSSLPQPWVKIQNPQSIQPVYNMTSLAEFYNNTLSSLSTYQYQNVSQALSLFRFLVISPAVTETTQNANSEISSMNQSLPELQYYLNETEYLYGIGSFTNASLALSSLCSYDLFANASLTQFTGPTTSSFSINGIPVNIYRPPTLVLQNEINSYYQQCLNYKSVLNGSSSPFVLTISSDQTVLSPYGKLWVDTGGELNVNATFEQAGNGISDQAVSFHVEGNATTPESLTTGTTGSIIGALTIPYFYQSFVLVWATVQGNNNEGIPFVISNILNMTLLYNQTQIIINDPPKLLPTFPFTVSGALRDNSTGRVLPNAPVRIISFNTSYFMTTNSQGVFSDILTVPANATDGLHYIYADFAPKGAYGPSVNFTSIVVYRIPISLTIKKPSVIIPGLPTTLSGVVSANGSALSNAQVILNTPWGIYNTATDSNGRFSLPLSVPLSDFGFNLQVTLIANPSQAYFSESSTNFVVGILNLVAVAIIVLAVGFGTYQARNLGIRFPKIKRKDQDKKAVESNTEANNEFEKKIQPVVPSRIPSEIFSSRLYSPIIRSYLEALALAERKFATQFVESMTIRETALLISNLDQEKKEAAAAFKAIAIAAEDYLYSEKRNNRDFLTEETKLVQEYLSKLKDLWNME